MKLRRDHTRQESHWMRLRRDLRRQESHLMKLQPDLIGLSRGTRLRRRFLLPHRRRLLRRESPWLPGRVFR